VGGLGSSTTSLGGTGAGHAQRMVLGAGPASPAGKKLVAIKPPVIGDADSGTSDDDLDEAGERPLSREEIRMKTIRSMTKKQGDSTGPGVSSTVTGTGTGTLSASQKSLSGSAAAGGKKKLASSKR
jgi:hypothetical protein